MATVTKITAGAAARLYPCRVQGEEGHMKNTVYRYRRAAIGLAAGVVASLSFAGEAQAEFTGPGLYVIRVANTNTVLDIFSGVQVGGPRRLVRWGENGGGNQRFAVLPAPNGVGYVIRPLHSLECLDVPGFGDTAGLEIVQWPCANGTNESFHITLNERHTTIRPAHADRLLYARREGGDVVLAVPPPAPWEGMLFEFIRI
jgi:Ricin-type beta-trefoil lectin domain-like